MKTRILYFILYTLLFTYQNQSFAAGEMCDGVFLIQPLSLSEFATKAHRLYPLYRDLDVAGYIRSGLNDGKMILQYHLPMNPKSKQTQLFNELFLEAEKVLIAQWAYADILNYYIQENKQQRLANEDFQLKSDRARAKFKELYHLPFRNKMVTFLTYLDPHVAADVGLYQTLLLIIHDLESPSANKFQINLKIPKINGSKR